MLHARPGGSCGGPLQSLLEKSVKTTAARAGAAQRRAAHKSPKPRCAARMLRQKFRRPGGKNDSFFVGRTALAG